MFYYSIRGDDTNGWVMSVFKYIDDPANPMCVQNYSKPEEFDKLEDLLKRQAEYQAIDNENKEK